MSTPPTTDESTIGIWMWVFMFVAFNATWISFDLWLRNHGHEYLTTEFREGLSRWPWNLVLPVMVVLTVTLFVAHMWYRFW